MSTFRSDVKPAWFALDLEDKSVHPEIRKLSELQDKVRAQLQQINADFETAVRKHAEASLRKGAAEAIKEGDIDPSKKECVPENGEMIFGYNYGRKSVAFVKPTAKSTSKNTLKLG
jgi:hypothetical protein